MAYLPPNAGRMNVTFGGNTAGAAATVSTGTMGLAGGNNITLSQNGNAITINGATNQNISFSAGGNTLLTSSGTFGANSMWLNGQGAASVGFSNSSMFVSAPATSGLSATGAVSISSNGGTISIGAPYFNGLVSTDGNTAGNTGSVASQTRMVLVGGSNVTLSQTTGAGGNSISIHAATNALTSQSNQAVSGSNGSFTFQTLSLSNANGISFGTSAGSAVTASYTVPTQTVQTQNLHNLTLSGNTAGVMAQVSSGTLTLAGGNNITLSQNGNAITISGGAGGAAGSNTIGMSNLGNTSGTSGVISGSALQYALAGGNNVTLSQSINGSSATVTISAANQTAQTQNLHNLTLSGNTAGVMAQVSSGTLTLAGGNNVTLSQNGNAVTISAANQSTQTLAFSAGGNTSLTSTGTFDARSVWLNGLGAASVGFSSSSMFVSAPTQTAQTQNRFNLTLSGNTAGVMAQVSSGTLTLAGGNNITLSQNGNAITISGGAGGGGGGIALANAEATFNTGTANLIVAGGAMTIASTTGQSFNFSVPATSSLSATGALSIVTNGSTISIGVPYDTNNFYQNMDRGATALLGTANGTLMLQRLNQENARFAANLTANTVMMNISGSVTATLSSSAHTFSVSIGIYSDNITNLSLINSASSSWALAANTSNTAAYHGPRWLSFVASQWSSAPNFVNDGEYVFGVVFRSAGLAIPMSYIGQNYMQSVQRSGSLGVSAATNTSLAQGNYWNAMYTATTSALPTVISSNQVNRNNATAIFMPHIILNNRYSGTF